MGIKEKPSTGQSLIPPRSPVDWTCFLCQSACRKGWVGCCACGMPYGTSAAWERVKDIPGIRDQGQAIFGMQLVAGLRSNRLRYRKIAAILARMWRLGRELNDLLGSKTRRGFEPRRTFAPPDDLSTIQAFEVACRQVVIAVDGARKSIPPSARLTDDPLLAKAPSEARLPKAMVAMLRDAGFPATGARLPTLPEYSSQLDSIPARTLLTSKKAASGGTRRHDAPIGKHQ